MTIVEAWIDSLSFLKPKNAHLFILVTLKAILDAYKKMFQYWWWLIVAIGICCLFSKLFILSDILYNVLIFSVCLSTRPSLFQKNNTYFFSYRYAFIFIILYIISILFLRIPLLFLGISLPLYTFFLFFFSDSSKRIKAIPMSFFRAIKMIFYNAPLMIILMIIGYICIAAIYVLLGMFSLFPVVVVNTFWGESLQIVIQHNTKNFLSSLVLPIPICTYANIYIKKLHDQFDLYFKRLR